MHGTLPPRQGGVDVHSDLMLIEFGDAFDFSAADFQGWCREVGFRDFKTIALNDSHSAAVAYK